MAFHNSRGAARGRGRGNSMNGSRGQGRGGFRGGRGKPIFDSVRIAQQKEKDEEREDSDSEIASDPQDSLIEDNSSDEDEEGLPTVHSYAALMQSFAAQPGPHGKRRKLMHDPALGQDEEDEEAELTHDADNTEEAEEGPETATDGLFEESEDELEDVSDPFEVHFADPNGDEVSNSLKALQENRFRTQKVLVPNIGKAIISIPSDNGQKVALPPVSVGPEDLRLKQKLNTNFSKERLVFDRLDRQLASIIFNHTDLLFCERNPTNAESLRQLICLHSLNHIFKTRDRVIKNNARLAREEHDDSLELRDQGFTRPKVLFILPTRESCHRIMNTIISLCEPEQQENRKRFEESFIEKTEKFSEDKAADFRELFGGNDDDMFRLGMKFTRKTIKYFSQFYNSDIICASPLGLRMALEGKDQRKGDYDFLSSIELVIVDQADALLMQNWEHVEYIFEHLNLQPREAHGCDFSRVRSWYLDNHAKYFRQTIALSAFNTPELNTLFYNQSMNWRGKIKISATYPGAIQELGLKIKQTFSRLESPSFATDPDVRFTYFTTAIIPTLTRRTKDNTGTMVFIPSYLDFVRVRNYFATSPVTSSLSFGNISEYTSVQDVARARSHFLSGRHSILLYTERAHHFRRYQIRGVQKVIMYGLPDNPIFYKEIIGGCLGRSVQEGKLAPGEGAVRVIFSKWDVLKLERVAGTERVGKMINEKGDTFDFL